MNKYLVEYSGYGSDYLVTSDSIEIESQLNLEVDYTSIRKEVMANLRRHGYYDVKIIRIMKCKT